MTRIFIILAVALLASSHASAAQAFSPKEAFAAAARPASKESREQKLGACRKKAYDARYRD